MRCFLGRSKPLEQKNADLDLPSQSVIELKDLQNAVRIGTYGPDDVVPDEHILDMTLTISSHLVMVPRDEMALVFDYDPLIRRIDTLARSPL